MTEQRSTYGAISSEALPPPAHKSSALASLARLIPSKPDIILLLPILESLSGRESPASCLQLVHLANGDLGLCNHKTEAACACCTASVCLSHSCPTRAAFPNASGTWPEEHEVLLCETCASVSRATRSAIHAFCCAINALQETDS